MNPTLQHRLDQIWSAGAVILSENRPLINRQLTQWLFRLSNDSSPPWNEPLFRKKMILLTQWFMESIPSLTNTDRRHIVKTIRDEWQARYLEPSAANELMLLLSSLENAVYRALSSALNTREHQALQYWFFTLYQAMLQSVPVPVDRTIFLQKLLDRHQIPIHWVACVGTHQGRYTVKDILCPTKRPIPADRINETIGLCSETVKGLSTVLQHMLADSANSANKTIVPIPLKQETLLFATDAETADWMKTCLSAALHLYIQRQKRPVPETDWKDALILFGQSVARAKNLQETLERIATGFVQYLPFERVALFAYSPTDHAGIGMYGYQYNDHAVRKIKVHIANIPLFQHGVQNHHPIYVPDAARGFPYHYVKQFQLQSVVIAPLYLPVDNKVLGAAVLDQGEDKPFELSAETWTALMKFSKYAAETLTRYWKNGQLPGHTFHHVRLSPREHDVIQLMADGLSIGEAAQTLSLSEFTVRDYIASAVKKLNAKNRTQAVAIALRLGLIS